MSDLRAALERLDSEAATADHDSIEDGPAFARGLRYGVAQIRAALAEAEPTSEERMTDVRLFAEDLIAEIGLMMSVESWSKVETQARRSAYNDVLAAISDRLAVLSLGAAK